LVSEELAVGSRGAGGHCFKATQVVLYPTLVVLVCTASSCGAVLSACVRFDDGFHKTQDCM